MAGKKMPGRFTIQFNLEDPQQRAAAELLEQQGRRKAQFLSSAILQYVHQNDACKPGGIDRGALKAMMLELLNSDPDFPSFGSDVPKKDASELDAEKIPGAWPNFGSEEAMTAISNTLAAFQQQ